MLPEQLTLFSENSYVVEPSRFGSTIVKNDSISTQYQRFEFDIESSNGAVNIYYAGGTSRGKKKYYRYSWREKNKMRHCHIPGGNIDSISAKKRAALVQCEIDSGRSSKEIVEFIKSFGRHD
jgi:hypothetical protein